jgi:pimeloyl-ACP methyl ester carboxylesterase
VTTAMNDGVSQYVSTPGGQTLHITRWGTGPRPCLLLHGFGEGGYVWSDFSRRMPSHYTSVALDFRGHGDSSWEQSGIYTTTMHVDDVIAAIDALDFEAFVLVGHSMGAEVAIHVAIKLASRILGLVIVDYGPDLNEEGRVQMLQDLRESLGPYRSVQDYLAILEEKRFLATPEILSNLASNALRVGSDGLFRLKCDPALVDMIGDTAEISSQLWDSIRMIHCPTLLVRGNGSAVLPRQTAYRIRDCLGPASLRQVDLAGHGVMVDNPDGFAAAVMPFLATLST